VDPFCAASDRGGRPANSEGPQALAEERAALRRVATLVASGTSPAEVFAAVTEEVVRVLAGVCAVAIAGCSTSTPHSGGSSRRGSVLAFSKCMRNHGVSGFPDPTTTPPANPGDYSIAEGIAGDLFLLVPNTIDVDSPAFKRTAVACKLG
jgi:hypothetical protein